MDDKRNFEYYLDIVYKCEKIISEEAVKWKTGNNLNYYFLSMYAKVILTVKETFCLLNNGYPDGALARAREVYEQMVIAAYIDNNYSDELLDRYFADYDLQVYRNRKLLYEKLCNIDVQCKEDYQNLARECEEKINKLKAKYGKVQGNYWWILDREINNFNDLQEKVEVSLMLVFYKRACISTHAGALNNIALLGRNNEHGSLLRTDQTEEGFEAPIFLLMASFDELTQIVFRHFDLSLPYNYNLKDKYKELWKVALQ